MIYDCAIIGTGPAGIQSALNLKKHNKSFLLFGSTDLSDKVNRSEVISNYPGFIDINGKELNELFRKQLEHNDIQITEKMVNQIVDMGEDFALLAGSDYYQSKTVILASGVTMKNTIVNEKEYLGRGVSYCATCDGTLYKGKTIAVICNNPRLEYEVNYLADLAERVYYFPQYADCRIDREDVTVIYEFIVGVYGDMKVNRLQLASQSINIDGLFCLRDSIAIDALLAGLQMEDGHIRVNENMETNIKGVYAAGDCTGAPYQISRAIGQGSVASLKVVEYLGSAD